MLIDLKESQLISVFFRPHLYVTEEKSIAETLQNYSDRFII